MNAYELAEHLDKANYVGSHKSAQMLRQQADRIAELEKFNKAILKKGGCDGNICKRYDTYLHKELSDEEIQRIAEKHLKAFAQFIGAGEVCYEGEIEFARAIIKASRGKE